MAVSNFQITGTRQLIDLDRRLRAEAGAGVRRSMTRRIRAAAEPLRSDLQRTVRTLPVTGSGGTSRRRAGDNSRAHRTVGLREGIARSIRISVRTGSRPGARVWIDRAALPPDQRNLPARLDEGKWRHPVFGNRHKWASQYAKPWWGVTITRHTPRIRAQVARVIDDIERRLG